jgi:thioredoxin 1
LLGVARNLSNRFACPDLELSYLMDKSVNNNSVINSSVTIKLDESNFDREVNQNEKAVIVDFWAEWCGPCKMIAPLLDEIAKEKGESVKVAKVNVDENQSLSFKFNIRAIPSLLFFKNGQLRDQVTGMTSKKDLLGRIEALG